MYTPASKSHPADPSPLGLNSRSPGCLWSLYVNWMDSYCEAATKNENAVKDYFLRVKLQSKHNGF